MYVVTALLLLGWQAPDSAGKNTAESWQARLARVSTESTSTEVRKLLGDPARTSRQIIYRRYREQWTYNGRPAALIEIECIRGQQARVLRVHILDKQRLQQAKEQTR
jgi:hypothetical protein